MLNKAEYPRKVTTVKSIILNYQPNYNSNRNSQSNGARNQIMFAQCGKTGDDEGNGKEKEKIHRRNLDHITCNSCGEKVHYAGNSKCPTQKNTKEDTETFKNLKQENSPNKLPGGGYQKALVNVKDASCSLMMVHPTEEWGEPPYPGLMFCQTSIQEVPHTEPINNNTNKGNPNIMHVGNNILAAAVEDGMNKNWCLLNNQ